MRLDTRPWIQVKPSDQNPAPQVGKPIAMPLQFVNVGKTPAKRFLAYMFVEVVDIDKSPHLPELEGAEIRSWTRVQSGILFPSVSVDGLAKSVKSTSGENISGYSLATSRAHVPPFSGWLVSAIDTRERR
jgi:hypothetical protein